MASTPNTPMIISKKAQQGLLEFHNSCYNLYNQNWNLRSQLERMDRLYIRENDLTEANQRAKAANRYGDANRFQNITVPIVMPQVEAAVTYQSSVFLTGNPIFGVVSNPATMDAAMQMETVIGDQSVRGAWVSHIQKFFRDGFKYNLGAIEVAWARCVTPAFETDLSFSTTQAKPKEVIWEGNTIKHLSLYNMVFDTRVAPTEHYQKGEFCGYTELMSRIQLKAFINSLPDKMLDNIVPAFESGLGYVGTSNTGGVASYYIPQLNPNALVNQATVNTTNWMAWASLAGSDNKIQYKDSYAVTTLYAKILPSDFGIRVPSPNTPQIWKFIYVNHQVLIYAERQTNAHGYIPVLFCQPNEDGLELQTKSLAANVGPMQDFSSACWNSVIASRRRAISDRVLYDPSRISEAHINSDNPSAKIPVRPAAYGKPVGESVYPFPYRDDQSAILMQESAQVMQMANMISGQNQVRQGQFVKGNKTLHEFQSVMSNANGRDQVVSMLLEAQVFTPLKEILKVNILQYQGGVSLFNREKEQMVVVDPVALRKAVMEFKVSDGLTPSDKLINSDTLQVAMQVIGSSPQIAAGYNLAPMFSYFIKTQGGKITEFEKTAEQIAYEQGLQQWQMMIQQILAANPQVDPRSLPPQPVPQQYGYVPQGNNAGQIPGMQPATVKNQTNNITNNISNNGSY